MDQFGYEATLRMALEIFENASRGTGRTTRVLDQLKENDVFVIANNLKKSYFEYEIKNRNLQNVKVFHISEIRDSDLIKALSINKIHFDHTAIFEMTKDDITYANRFIKTIKAELENRVPKKEIEPSFLEDVGGIFTKQNPHTPEKYYENDIGQKMNYLAKNRYY